MLIWGGRGTLAAETIQVTCACGRGLTAPAEYAGKLVRCKHCRATFRAPELFERGDGVREEEQVQLRVLQGEGAGGVAAVTTFPFVLGRK